MAYNPLTDFQSVMQRAQANTGYENYGREYFDPQSGMNIMRGVGGTGQDWANQWANSGDNTGGGSMTLGMSGVGQGDIWRTYDGAAGREAQDNFALNGSPYQMYDESGAYSGQGTWEGLDKNTPMKWAIPLAMMAAPFALTAMGVGGAAGAAGGGAAGAGAGGAATASELAGAGLGFGGGGTGIGAGAYGSLGAIAPEAMAAAMGMTPEAFTALGAGGLGAAGASGGMLAGTSAATGGGGGSWLSNLLGGGGAAGGAGGAGGISGLLGPGAALYGAVSGAQGTPGGGGGGGGGGLDSRAEPYIYGSNGLFPQSQGLLNAQAPQANALGQQVTSKGAGLLGAPVAGNGYGQIQLDAPNTPTNPYATGILDDLQRRQKLLMDQGLQSVKGNAVGVGGLGGSRQGVAEAETISRAADNFTGQAANFMGGLYNSDQSRALQKYQGDQSFYGNQRGQDLSQAQLGSNFIGQGFQQQWQPFMNASDIYKPYTGLSSASGNSSGGGWQGAVGGLLGGLQFGKSMGWWG